MTAESNNGPADAVPPPFAATALALTVQDWTRLGLDDDDTTTEGNNSELCLLESLVERVTSLLLVRIVAVLVKRKFTADDDTDRIAQLFPDLSTSTICRTVLVHQRPWMAYAPEITDDFLRQLKSYVRTILMGYNDTPYHCKDHAHHVVISVNKLTDLMLQSKPGTTKTYGLRHDAIALFAMVFAALVHDVEHTGVPNRQLVIENDPLAILYNDQSIAEQRSLFIAFDELLKPEYSLLRNTIFQISNGRMDSDEYRRFRKIVIDLVLNTDIASPERTQLAKSKWREAFGDTFESMERKLKQHLGEQDGDASVSDSETPDSSENGDACTHQTNVASVAADSVSISYSYNVSNSSFDSSPEDDDDGVIVSGTTLTSTKNHHDSTESVVKHDNFEVAPLGGNSPLRGRRFRRGHAHSMPMGRRNSVQQLLQSDEYCKAKFQRRMSSYANPAAVQLRPENFRKRLGIRRSMDLGGEAIESYHRTASAAAVVDDEPDELKATVVMETIMTAADVAHNLQGWSQMVIWSGRLYLELRKAYVEGRGVDPQTRWFENQIGFLESYLLPLARRLEDMGVFGEYTSQTFAFTVEANRDKWLIEGQEVTEAIIAKGEETYDDAVVAEASELLAENCVGKSGRGQKFRTTNLQ
jgi:3'5'-cyclic nucleotide phosphodiesterase